MFKKLPLLSVLAIAFMLSSPGQSQDIAAGEAVFKKCMACHRVGPDAKHRSGPILNNVVGRAAASADGYKYKKSIVAARDKGLIWDEANLQAYLGNPTEFLREYLDDPKARSAMSFKLIKEQEQLDVIAYIASVETEASAADGAEATEPTEPVLSIDEIVAAQSFTDEYINDPVNISAGKEIWFAQCTHCHGFKAYPGKAPKLKPAKYEPEFVFKRVYKGFKKMPAWNEVYSVDEVRQVVAYIKAPGFAP